MLTRGSYALLAAAWLFFAVTYLVIAGERLALMTMPDPDDYLRLQQVRDWLAGQGWFDVVQHRINPPIGGAMHWTRVVDLPLAALIVALRPFIGQPAAELTTAIVIPALTMGVIMVIVASIAARLLDRRWAIVAAVAAPLSAWIYVSVMPLRIDHHGWQIVAALAMLGALLDEENPRRSGIAAGAAAALWLNISLEGLPVIASTGALLGVRWLLDRTALPRLQAFIWTIAAACFLLETATVANAWANVECDRVSRSYVLAMTVMAGAAWVWRFDLAAADWRRRLVAMAVSGAAAAAVFAMQGPQCLAGPFATLDPVTKTFWLDRVGESLPMWKRGPGAAIIDMGFAALGCIGAALALRAAPKERARWITVLVLCACASLLMIAVSRAGAVAHAYSVFGAAFIGRAIFARARAIPALMIRAPATAFAVIAATPALFLPAAELDASPPGAGKNCTRDYSALQALPPGVVFAALDNGPEIIARTAHSVIATGHHRNHEAMRDVILAFIGDEAHAYAQVKAHRARYMVICPVASEIQLYAQRMPHGFAADLLNGNRPAWLVPVALPGAETMQTFLVRDAN